MDKILAESGLNVVMRWEEGMSQREASIKILERLPKELQEQVVISDGKDKLNIRLPRAQVEHVRLHGKKSTMRVPAKVTQILYPGGYLMCHPETHYVLAFTANEYEYYVTKEAEREEAAV